MNLGRKVKLKEVYWESTRKCNLKCIHCSNRSSDALPDELNTNEVKALLRDLRGLSVEDFRIYGGEPLLREDIFKIGNIAKGLGMQLSLYTNGMLINEEIATELKRIEIDRVLVSIDGVSETHDRIRKSKNNFNKVIENIKLLRAYGIKTTINFTVSKMNKKDIKNVYTLAKELETNEIKPNLITRLGRADAHWNLFCQSRKELKECAKEIYKVSKHTFGTPIRKGSCKAGTEILFITANGDMHPCPLFITKEFCIGNIREKEIKKAWNSPKALFSTLRQVIRRGEYCTMCKVYKNICTGGCRARAYYSSGSLYAPDIFSCYLQEVASSDSREIPRDIL